MQLPKKSILFFIASFQPTDEEFAAAAKLGTTKFRNVSAVNPEENPEPCDAVAGLAPDNYLKQFPRADAPVEPPPPPPPPPPTGPDAPWKK
jgi:hypothetical protein